MMRKQKYVIVSYRVQAGGVIVLHNLCRLLNELGQDASVPFFIFKIFIIQKIIKEDFGLNGFWIA